MITIQVNDKSEQALALVSYLKTLPFVKFVESEEQVKNKSKSRKPVLNPEPEAVELPEPEVVVAFQEVVEENVVEYAAGQPEEDNSGIDSFSKNETQHFFSEALEKKLLTDLKKALSLNDKYRFQNELFNKNATEMNDMLDLLNGLSSFPEAWAFLEKKYNWSQDNDSVVAFRQLLEKRFA